MAGESPEKAEQQESSQEATPGGGGRDPRLSVFRESSSSAASSASSVSRSSASSSSASAGEASGAEAESESGAVRVDQPTAVFKTLTPRAPEDDAPAAEAPRTQTPEPKTPAAETPAAEDGGEGGEDRLRAAVAAWVASGDEAATTDAEAADGAEGPETAVETVVDGEAIADEAGEPVAAEAEPEPEADTDVTSEAPEAGEAPERAAAPEAGTDADAGPAKDWFASRKPGKAENPADAPAAEDEQPEAEPEADAAPAEPALDQPTAVFKAVRPPVTDQPTTALKLPPVTPVTPSAKPTPTDGAAPEAAKAPESAKAPEATAGPSPAKAKAPSTPQAPKPPESDAERTSQFIPLRRDLPEAAAAPAPAPQRPAEPKPSAAAPSTPAAATPPASLTEAERTRQQPMPPLPPLDLLAELTNTPPPQPTALRTTVRRVRIWTPLVILLLIIFAIVQFVRPLPAPALALSTAPTYTFAGGALNMPWPAEGQGAAEVEGVGSLGTYGAQKPAPIASVAKTMTAYVILRDHPIKGNANGPEITVDKKAGEQAKAKDESTAQIEEGQKYSEKELLQLLMIPSGNNVARLLARWDAGTEAAFVDKMNAAAKDLGMTGSVYTDPSGLQATTVSTPLDQLKLAKAVMQYDVFREIVNMPNLTVDGIPGQIENNNNILLKPGVGGIKTGSSTPAGGNLLWSANTVIDGKSRRILGVVMGAKDADQLYQKLQLAIDYSLKLIQQAQKDVTSAPVVRKGQVVGYVDDGLGGRTPVIATKELKAIGWPGLKVDLELTDGGTAVPHAAKAGAIVGQVSIGTGTGKVSAPVALQADLVEPGFDKKLTRIG